MKLNNWFILLFFTLMLLTTKLFGQDQHIIDSLSNQLSLSKSNTEKVKHLALLSEAYLAINLNKSTTLAKEALAIASQRKEPDAMWMAFDALANIHQFRNDQVSAVKTWHMALAYTPDELQKARILQKIANAFHQTEHFDSAIFYYNLALPTFQTEASPSDIAFLLESQANTYMKLEEPKAALTKTNEATIMLEKAIKAVTETKNYNRLLAQIIRLQAQAGNISIKLGEYNQAINYFQKAIPVAVILGNKYQLALLYDDIGDAFKQQGRIDKAAESYNRALNKALQIKDDQLAANVYNSLGGLFLEQNNPDIARANFLNALEIHQKMENQAGLAKVYNNLAEVFRIEKQYDSALVYYDKSISLNRILVNKLWLGVNYQNKAETYLANKDQAKSYEFLTKARELFVEINDFEHLAAIDITLANYHLSQNQYKMAELSFLNAYQKAEEIHALRLTRQAAQGLAKLYENSGDINKAFFYLKRYTLIQDSLYSTEMAIKLANYQSKSQLEEIENAKNTNEEQIRTYEKNRRINLFVTNASLLVILLLLIIGYLLMKRHKGALNIERAIAAKNDEIHRTQQALMEAELKNKELDTLTLNSKLAEKDYNLINMALQIAKNNEFTNDLKKTIKEIKSAKDSDRDKKLTDLMLSLNHYNRSSKDLERFLAEVEKSNATFFKKLSDQFPDLTENEKQLAAMLRIDLSSKEIAALNNISTKAVEMSRYRLRKKLGMETNDNLSEFFQKL